MAFLQTLKEKADPAHAALMVLDLQQGFWPSRDRPHTGHEVIPCLLRLIDAARAVSLPIIYIRNSFSHWVNQPAWFERWQFTRLEDVPDYCIEGTPGVDVMEGLSPQPGELVLNKHFWSPFAHGPLDLALRSRGIKTVLLTGGAILGAIETVAKDSVVRGYYAVMVKDCIYPLEGRLPEVIYDYSQARLAQVVTSQDVMAAWQDRRG